MKSWNIPHFFLILLLVLLFPFSSSCTKSKTKQDGLEKEVGIQSSVVMDVKEEDSRKLISQEVKEVTVHFLTENEKNLVPVTIPINGTEQGAKAAIQRLIVGTSEEAIKPVINTSTKLRKIYLKDNLVYLDLTNHFLDFTTEELGEWAIISILRTLVPFLDGQRVQILIDGEIVQKVIGNFDISQPLLLESETELNAGEHLITIYYAEPNGIYFVPVTKKITDSDPVKAAMMELVKGPGEQSGLSSTIWDGTKVLGVDVKYDLVEINFNRQALSYGGGTTAENVFVKSVLLTLTEYPDINKVQFLFEGEKLKFLPEGTEVGEPLVRPEHINFKQ